MKCVECETEHDRRHLNMIPVHVEHDDGPGYDRVPMPMCERCRLERFGIPCSKCDRMHPDHEAAFRCQDPRFAEGCGRGSPPEAEP